MTGFLQLVLDFFKLIFVRVQALALSHFLATKIVMGALFVSVLPVVLNNLVYDLVEIVINVISGVELPVGNVSISEFGGLGGWLLVNLKVVDAMNMILSAVAYRFTIKLVTLGRV